MAAAWHPEDGETPMEMASRHILEQHTRPGFWDSFIPESAKSTKPLTRRERLRWWRKVEAPRRIRYAAQVIRRGYHEGEERW